MPYKYLSMKILFGLIVLCTCCDCAAQTIASGQSPAATKDISSSNIIFFEDFDNNQYNWTVGDNKKASATIEGGIYYLTATGHAYGEAQELKIDTRKDFEIETRIKIVSGNADHKNYYSMLFWGRQAMDSYYFTFAKDGFTSVELCSGKNQSDCTIQNGSLQKTIPNPEVFNVYTVRKKGNTYSFLVNGVPFYTMPFRPFFGNLIGFGAGRKVSLAVDYLKVMYL